LEKGRKEELLGLTEGERLSNVLISLKKSSGEKRRELGRSCMGRGGTDSIPRENKESYSRSQNEGLPGAP